MYYNFRTKSQEKRVNRIKSDCRYTFYQSLAMVFGHAIWPRLIRWAKDGLVMQFHPCPRLCSKAKGILTIYTILLAWKWQGLGPGFLGCIIIIHGFHIGWSQYQFPHSFRSISTFLLRASDRFFLEKHTFGNEGFCVRPPPHFCSALHSVPFWMGSFFFQQYRLCALGQIETPGWIRAMNAGARLLGE